jgi:hypothetical protein
MAMGERQQKSLAIDYERNDQGNSSYAPRKNYSTHITPMTVKSPQGEPAGFGSSVFFA